MIGLENFLRRLRGKEFRAFVHAPDRCWRLLGWSCRPIDETIASERVDDLQAGCSVHNWL
jgi:hypothetical protein